MSQLHQRSTDPAEEELGAQYRSLSSWLRSTVSRRYDLRDADAEDIMQESFIRLSRYEAHERGRHPRALLLKIAANLVTDARRRLARRHGNDHVPLDTLPAALPLNLVQPGDQALLIDLKAVILSLPDPLRETFLLARFTPLTQAEIAGRLGISTKTVEWRISKAVAICLAQLGR